MFFSFDCWCGRTQMTLLNWNPYYHLTVEWSRRAPPSREHRRGGTPSELILPPCVMFSQFRIKWWLWLCVLRVRVVLLLNHIRCQLSSAYRLCDWLDKISAGDCANGSTFKSSHCIYWIRNNIGFVSSTHSIKGDTLKTDVNEIFCVWYNMIPLEFGTIELWLWTMSMN